MSCGKATQIDVGRFLLESQSSAFADFRAHYPGCAECAAAVANWTALEIALSEGPDAEAGPGGHPEPDRLEALLAHRQDMGEEAMRIESHLEHCPRCRTELAVLRRFETGFVASVAGGTNGPDARDAREEDVTPFEGLRRFFGSLFGPTSSFLPALALALIVVFGAWWSGLLDGPLGRAPNAESTRVAEAGSGTPPGREPEATAPVAPVDEGDSLARVEPQPRRPDDAEDAEDRDAVELGDVEARVAESSALQSPSRETKSEPLVVAQAPKPEVVETPGPGTDASAQSGSSNEQVREEVLLAALTELPPPRYSAPSGTGSVGWLTEFGAVRSGPAVARIQSQAPEDHVGLSLSATPRLWWRLDSDTDLPVQLTIVDDLELVPVLRVELPGPHRAGLHSSDLAELGVTLDRGVEYRWFVSLIVDEDRPSRNPIAAGAIRVIPDADPRAATVRDTPVSNRGHALARLGLWYDAYDFFASLAAAHPEVATLAQHREHLVELAQSPR